MGFQPNVAEEMTFLEKFDRCCDLIDKVVGEWGKREDWWRRQQLGVCDAFLEESAPAFDGVDGVDLPRCVGLIRKVTVEGQDLDKGDPERYSLGTLRNVARHLREKGRPHAAKVSAVVTARIAARQAAAASDQASAPRAPAVTVNAAIPREKLTALDILTFKLQVMKDVLADIETEVVALDARAVSDRLEAAVGRMVERLRSAAQRASATDDVSGLREACAVLEAQSELLREIAEIYPGEFKVYVEQVAVQAARAEQIADSVDPVGEAVQ